MRIGFDAKRVFLNRSGLGNYSRDVIRSLLGAYPENEYFLYTPKIRQDLWQPELDGGQIISPPSSWGKLRQAWWRRTGITRQLQKDGVSLYHGLSNELPVNIERTAVRSIVTIHDLIFVRYPQWYPYIDRIIYRKKFRHAARIAGRIIAISKQTRADLTNYFGIPEEKIEVIYQGCYHGFYNMVDPEAQERARRKWILPREYLLYVGTIEKRKNLLTLLRGMHQQGISIPLLVVGRPTSYMKEIQAFIRSANMKNIRFLQEVAVSDLPAIYQMAKVFIYPSVFEGFGIPILEALLSGVPVITSKGGCFPEVGGENTIYVDPNNAEELGTELKLLLEDTEKQKQMIQAGRLYAKRFSHDKLAGQLMDLYKRVLDER